jgi:hypothetical protein
MAIKKNVRTCKTSIVIGPRKGEFCRGVAGRIWGKSYAGQKRRGSAILILKE